MPWRVERALVRLGPFVPVGPIDLDANERMLAVDDRAQQVQDLRLLRRGQLLDAGVRLVGA
jgi:hypothetical protein